MKKRNAFTLAEILVTMGIIGVVAALTVPNLVSNYQNKTMAVKARKSVNDIENTIDQYITEEGKSRFAYTKAITNNDLDTFITKNFNIIKTCEAKTSGCFASEKYMSIDGEKSTEFKCENKSYILADSTALCMKTLVYNKTYLLTYMWIDINGPEAPNIGGRDMYYFFYSYKPLFGVASDCISSAVGSGCIAKLQENNWKMDY